MHGGTSYWNTYTKTFDISSDNAIIIIIFGGYRGSNTYPTINTPSGATVTLLLRDTNPLGYDGSSNKMYIYQGQNIKSTDSFSVPYVGDGGGQAVVAWAILYV